MPRTERARKRHPVLWALLVILVLILIAFAVGYELGITNQLSTWLTEKIQIPSVNWTWMSNPNRSAYGESEPVESRTIPEATATPAPEPLTPTVLVVPQGTTATTAPTSAPTVAPSPEPTAEPNLNPITFTFLGYVKLSDDGSQVPKYSYSGGYHPESDPYSTNYDKKENHGSFGTLIFGSTPAEITGNLLANWILSPEELVHLRVQLGLEDLDGLPAENARADALRALTPAGYDEIVNATLSYFYEKLEGGTILETTDWYLECYLADETEGTHLPDDLKGRTNDDTDPKDKLLTFLDKEGVNFVSASRGLENVARDAGVNTSHISNVAWVNITEGGTWKWKRAGSPGTPPTDPPSPTATPKPTKDPSQIRTPKPGDDYTGPASTQTPPPDRKTDAPVTSTPAPKVTATPRPTATPAPTAVVNTPEPCYTPGTDIHDDYNPVLTSQPLPSKSPLPEVSQGDDADDSFDPGSI